MVIVVVCHIVKKSMTTIERVADELIVVAFMVWKVGKILSDKEKIMICSFVTICVCLGKSTVFLIETDSNLVSHV